MTVVRYARIEEESSTTRIFIASVPPRPLRCEHRVAERVSRLREEDLQTGHAVDRRAMLGVVAVQDTNRRGSLCMIGSATTSVGRTPPRRSISSTFAGVRRILPRCASPAVDDVGEDRGLVARDAQRAHARVHRPRRRRSTPKPPRPTNSSLAGHEERAAVEVLGGQTQDRGRHLADVVRIRQLVDQLPSRPKRAVDGLLRWPCS